MSRLIGWEKENIGAHSWDFCLFRGLGFIDSRRFSFNKISIKNCCFYKLFIRWNEIIFYGKGHVNRTIIYYQWVCINVYCYLVLCVLNSGNIESAFVRENESARPEPLVTCVKNCRQHSFVQQAITHPLRNDNIYSVDSFRQRNFFHFSTNKSD